jgi:hypothetical protein
MELIRPRELDLDLPIGYVDADGILHKTATLRKMTGRDEAIMADKRNRHNGARLITELLGSCLVRVGSIENPGTRVSQALYTSDRHFLLIKLREFTFGPEMQATYACPTCSEANVMVEDLATLDVVMLDDGELPPDLVVHLEDGYADRSGQIYTSLVFRHAVGADEEKIAPALRENASYGKNALMARCLKALGDMPTSRVQALGTAIFSDLTLSDRALIDKALNSGGPGIKTKRDLNCLSCGRSFTASLDFSSFLVPS